jgi:hypothetical protein
MNNGIGRLPLLVRFWQRLGAWVDRSGPRERPAAQIFFTIGAVLGTLLCFGFHPVLAGFRDWLWWRLTLRRTMSRTHTIRTLPRPTSGSAPVMTAWS